MAIMLNLGVGQGVLLPWLTMSPDGMDTRLSSGHLIPFKGSLLHRTRVIGVGKKEKWGRQNENFTRSARLEEYQVTLTR
jgi:hypothetical protein